MRISVGIREGDFSCCSERLAKRLWHRCGALHVAAHAMRQDARAEVSWAKEHGPLGANMETRACSTEPAAIGDAQSLNLGIREGDWIAYKQKLVDARYQNQTTLDSYGGIVSYKRRCALAYLGRRAQLHGGVCSRTQPRILTSAFLAKLEDVNRSQRFSRYPWLEHLLNLLAEIERVQDEAASSTNVISLVPIAKPQ